MDAKPAGNRGKGRPKGSPNKTTLAVKDALTQAFDKLGGVPALVRFAKKRPDLFYPLWGRMLPHEVNGNLTAQIQLQLVEEIIDDDPPETDRTANDQAPSPAV